MLPLRYRSNYVLVAYIGAIHRSRGLVGAKTMKCCNVVSGLLAMLAWRDAFNL